MGCELIIIKQIETNQDDYLDRNRDLLETLLKECVFAIQLTYGLMWKLLEISYMVSNMQSLDVNTCNQKISLFPPSRNSDF